MRKLILLTALLPCITILAGCPKKDADVVPEAAAPTVDEAAAAPADAAAATNAPSKNEKDVARFPAETKIANEAAKILSYTTVRTGPRSGSNVGTRAIGSDVTKIASYNDAFLITFADPSDPNSTLMGWVGKEAFVATIYDASWDVHVDANRPLTCGAGLVLVTFGGGPVCKKQCVTDANCKDKQVGSCKVAASATGSAKALHVCTNE